MIIFDGSGSMWGQIEGRAKIEIARDVISEVLADIGAETALGLMVYGHRREADCEDIEVLVSPATNTSGVIRARVDEISPRGKTPIGGSIIRASEVLEYESSPATVVLVTDGIETCGVDLCALAQVLEADGLDFTTHVIGFDVGMEERAGLECLADNTGGQYFSAEDGAGLSNALRQAVQAPEQSDDKGSSRLEDIIVRGSDVIFLAGRDEIVVPPGDETPDPDFPILRHAQLEEPLMETRPPFLDVKAGNIIQILGLAGGGIHFFPQANQPGWGPAGILNAQANIESLDGISGYKGPKGGLLGVFLGDDSPADHAPPATLDFSASDPGAGYTSLSPQLGQLFYIGNGTTDVPGTFKKVTAPTGATRLFLGIADGWGFQGPPGYYDDNDGEYVIRVGINADPGKDLPPELGAPDE